MSDSAEPKTQDPSGAGTATQDPAASARKNSEVKTKPVEPVRRPRTLPPYRVLLHNDNVNTFEHVIRSIVQLTTLGPEEAIERTVEAHETGVALLLVTHQERAELYQEQFASVQLTVTIEPA